MFRFFSDSTAAVAAAEIPVREGKNWEVKWRSGTIPDVSKSLSLPFFAAHYYL